jgi:ribosome-binding protein aMBF1 (putative translation factor)
MPFTAAEWEEMRRADEEIEREFRLSPEDLERDRELTRVARMERMDSERRRLAEKQRAYYEANRDSIAEKHRAYREANRDSIAAYQRWIRDARKAHGYTQRDMARMLGVSISAISRLESGELRLSGFKKRAELLALLKEGGDVSMQ